MTKVLALILFIFVYTACGQLALNTATGDSSKIVAQTSVVQKQTKDCVKFKFHYLELENVLYTPVVRHIEIFLDEKAFSEENLKTLFAYLSEKNPEPIHLTVVVHTNWAQLWLPSDCPPVGLTNQPRKPDEYDYHQATYYRRKKVEYFRYNPVLKVEDPDFKTVVLRNETNNAQ